MAFDKLKSFLNVDIKDGVRGKAVVQSATYPTESGTSGNVKMWLDVYVEGWEPYRMEHHCMVKKTKHPSSGETLPVMVDPKKLSGSELSGDLNEQIQQAMRMAQQPAEQPGQFAQPVEAAQPDRIAQLERLAALRDSGALTDEEFEAEKAKLPGG